MANVDKQLPQHYGIRHWGEGYFSINVKGHVAVEPRRDGASLDVYQLVNEAKSSGLKTPLLLRFNDVLTDRVRALSQAFETAANELDYSGGYRAIYPIKVNQQRSVVEQIASVGADIVGLEAGSKPELLAVLAASPSGASIVCNGYKDREYVRLALMGRKLGHDVYLVIEKPSELKLVLDEAAKMDIEPLLGVRIRLAAVASGNWQNSGGAKSKFGLSAAQLLELIAQLKAADKLHCLQLLHSHIGSQIPDLSDIDRGISEAARYYAELVKAGAPIQVIDVGGGLGVDYEGTASRHYCSINYSVNAYAKAVLRAIQQRCAEFELAEPRVFSESGRALTAHHAILITEVIEREEPSTALGKVSEDDDADVVKALALIHQQFDEQSPLMSWQEAKHQFDLSQQSFQSGEIDLEQRAHAEQWFYAIADLVRQHLRVTSRRHRDVLDELNDMLASRVFCNFSLFQSLPDAWALNQVFPLMPLHRLTEAPEQASVVHDLTCDSDGCLSQYVDQDGVESTLRLHATNGEPYLIGIFLVGAYQEILGDMHNLFGDTDAVNVSLTADGYSFSEPERGDRADELLSYVHFDPQQMLSQYQEKLAAAELMDQQRSAYLADLKTALNSTTYLTV